MSTWRAWYRPIIARIIRETAEMPEPARSKRRRQRFRREYPAQLRRGFAYQCWRDEIRRQLDRELCRSSTDEAAMKRFVNAERAGQLALDLEE